MTNERCIEIRAAKGRPMLQWVGKRPLARVTAFPAQIVEKYGEQPESGGLLFHGDNKEVLSHLLANGYRGKVDLIYIDPPFDSGADYVRRVRLRGPGGVQMEGQGYTLGEQIQYTDIWGQDNYLQFIFERLLLLKELLTEEGSIWVHCDWHKSHHIRLMMDEVFGHDNLLNEVIWQRTDPHNDARSRLGRVHDTLFWYRNGEDHYYDWKGVVGPLSAAALREYSLMLRPDGEVVPYSPENAGDGRRFKLDDCTWKGNDPSRQFEWRGATPSSKRIWPYSNEEEMDAALGRFELYLRDPQKGAARCRVSFLDERPGQVLQSIWSECGRMKGGVEYPTEKPYALLSRIVMAASKPNDLVLDAFAGSGTALLAAQQLGRRWIGSDINKGAIQIAAKRLQTNIQNQIAERAKCKKSPELVQGEAAQPTAAQYGFSVYRVNDYDLRIQHSEAVVLACEHIGVTRIRTDTYFDGTLGKRLVKIVPFDHPISPLDLEELKRELQARPDETRDIVMVALGKELAIEKWLDDWNRLRRRGDVPNKIEIIELRTDPKYGKFFAHKPATARVELRRLKIKLEVKIKDFMSPTIIERLEDQSGILQPKIDDWRAMVDCIMIDTAYNGEVFNVTLSDIPQKKADYVEGEYKFELPKGRATIAIKIIDMLGEEVLVTKEI